MTVLADGVISSNELVPAGSMVIVVPAASGSVLFEYTNGTAADITASTATWYVVTTTRNSLVVSADADMGDIYVRITCTGAAGTYEITTDMTSTQRYAARAYDRYLVNTVITQPVKTRDKFVLLEDFEGTWAIGDAGPADKWLTTKGSGTSTAVATTVAAALCGEVTLKSASDDGATSANMSAFTSVGLAYKANQGGLAVEARIKLDVVATGYIFVGFTDALSTTVNAPIFLVAADIDSDAANACGVCYDADGTTKQFFHGGVKANTDTVPVYSGTLPVAGTYFTVRAEVSAAGAIRGYVNGVPIGTGPVANSVTITTALTPAIIVGNRSAAQVIATIDYIKVEMNR